MADSTKKTSKTESEVPEAKFLEPTAPASESSDPEVHRLLAERQTAWMNNDKKSAEEYTAALKELGVE